MRHSTFGVSILFRLTHKLLYLRCPGWPNDCSGRTGRKTWFVYGRLHCCCPGLRFPPLAVMVRRLVPPAALPALRVRVPSASGLSGDCPRRRQTPSRWQSCSVGCRLGRELGTRLTGSLRTPSLFGQCRRTPLGDLVSAFTACPPNKRWPKSGRSLSWPTWSMGFHPSTPTSLLSWQRPPASPLTQFMRFSWRRPSLPGTTLCRSLSAGLRRVPRARPLWDM